MFLTNTHTSEMGLGVIPMSFLYGGGPAFVPTFTLGVEFIF
jgi:hypothetical protein